MNLCASHLWLNRCFYFDRLRPPKCFWWWTRGDKQWSNKKSTWHSRCWFDLWPSEFRLDSKWILSFSPKTPHVSPRKMRARSPLDLNFDYIFFVSFFSEKKLAISWRRCDNRKARDEEKRSITPNCLMRAEISVEVSALVVSISIPNERRRLPSKRLIYSWLWWWTVMSSIMTFPSELFSGNLGGQNWASGLRSSQSIKIAELLSVKLWPKDFLLPFMAFPTWHFRHSPCSTFVMIRWYRN